MECLCPAGQKKGWLFPFLWGSLCNWMGEVGEMGKFLLDEEERTRWMGMWHPPSSRPGEGGICTLGTSGAALSHRTRTINQAIGQLSFVNVFSAWEICHIYNPAEQTASPLRQRLVFSLCVCTAHRTTESWATAEAPRQHCYNSKLINSVLSPKNWK